MRRVFELIFVLFLLSLVLFYLARLAPGDPLQSFYGDSLEMMPEEEKEIARNRLGLNASIGVQYVRWLSNAFRGDFGLSFKYKIAGYGGC